MADYMQAIFKPLKSDIEETFNTLDVKCVEALKTMLKSSKAQHHKSTTIMDLVDEAAVEAAGKERY